MRRKDREIVEPARIDEVIARCDCCRLGLVDAGRAYVVPMNFGYRRENGQGVFYFHCAREGRKLDVLRQNPEAAFELDTAHLLRTGERGCDCSFAFESVMGEGTVQFVEESTAKREALGVIMRHMTGRADWTFDEAMLRSVTVLRLCAREMTCKRHE